MAKSFVLNSATKHATEVDETRTENGYVTARRGEEHHMISRRLCSFILIVILAGASACRPGPQFGPPPPPGPAPVISSISPTSETAGGAAFTLTVNGSHFLSGADLVWRNPDNPGFSGGAVTLLSSSQVTLQIPSAVIAIPGSAQILVFNPDSSPQSNTVSFVINPGPPGGAQVISQGANGPSDSTPARGMRRRPFRRLIIKRDESHCRRQSRGSGVCSRYLQVVHRELLWLHAEHS